MTGVDSTSLATSWSVSRYERRTRRESRIVRCTKRRNVLAVGSALLVSSFYGCRQSQESAPTARLIEQVTLRTTAYTPEELPSLRLQGTIAAHVQLNGDLRPAIVTSPTPRSRVSLVAHVPTQPYLRFAIASVVSSEATEVPLTQFRISVAHSTRPEVLYSETVGERGHGRWLERTVDLSDWSERQIELVLESVSSSDADGENVFALWSNPVVTEGVSESDGPSLILISVDCLRADHVGTYGYGAPTTPNLDAFAKTGVVFETAVSTAPWTIPSHYSMLTGLPPSFHGVGGSPEDYWHGEARSLSSSVPYLPELLAREGYVTHAVVSSEPVSATFGFQRGFGSYIEVHPDAATVVDVALRLSRRSIDRKQFLFVHFLGPHAPYLPKVEFGNYSREFIERFGPRPKDISDLLDIVRQKTPPLSPSDVEGVKQLYDASIAYVDHHIGRLLNELDHSGVLHHSVVVVTSDHGEGFYEHDQWQHANSLYEELLRVPLIVSWPDGPRGRSMAGVSIVDIFPTLLAAAGAPIPASQGVNLEDLVTALVAPREFEGISEVTIVTSEGLRTLISLRQGHLKYIATLGAAFDEATVMDVLREELYNIEVDPGETMPIQEVDAASRRHFRQVLGKYLNAGHRARATLKPGGALSPDDETLRMLKALGYVQ